ncbi:MAG TPA: isochorismatase family protein [Rectinemataceae bacterium]|nr:isochorismatase family protein [Rectinemataceae bacterium]
MKMALMVVDMQNAYSLGKAAESMGEASEYIEAALPLFRSKGLPVVWVQHLDEKDGAVPGELGFEIIGRLEPLAGEHRVRKTYNNSFNKTQCAAILAGEGVDTVLITGYCAEYCVLSTYRGALDLDLTPMLLRGGIASGELENLRTVERISDLISFGALKKVLE